MSTVLPLLVLDPDLDPWDRQPDETPLRHSQFRAFMDVGRGRTLSNTAETLGRHRTYLWAVAHAYRWVERAEAHDRHLDEMHERVWLDERRKAAEYDARLLQGATSLAARRLRSLNETDLSPGDLIRLLDVIMRRRRELFGDPTMTVAVTGPGGDPLTVQLAELAALTPDQRRTAVLGLADDVRRRALAAAGGADDDT